MPNLSLIEAEAERLVGRFPEPKRRKLQEALVGLCKTRWQEVRGPRPKMLLSRTLWPVTPPLADLFMDLYAGGDARLDEVLQGCKPVQGLALLVFAEIERGNAEGVRIAHEPMMVFQTISAAMPYAERIAALLRGRLDPPVFHRHDSHPPLWKALSVIATQSKRHDIEAVLCIIDILSAPGPSEPTQDRALEKLRDELREVGVRFLGIDDDHIYFEQHGHKHKPMRARRLEEMLLQIRQVWLE